MEHKWTDSVRAVLNGEEVARGPAVAEMGWGYSGYTSVDSDHVSIGRCDLLERLADLEGQHVELTIEDESLPGDESPAMNNEKRTMRNEQ